MTEDHKEEGKKVHRSPGYPSISLKKGVELIEKVYNEDRQMPTSLEVVAKHLGFSTLHGSAHRVLAALKAYGLLDELPENKVKVGDLVMKILFPHFPEEKSSAVLEAVYRPKIYSEIIDHYGGDVSNLSLPSNENLRSFLIREKSFNSNRVDDFIADFRDSLFYAQDLNRPENVDSKEFAQGKAETSPIEQEALISVPSKLAELPIPIPLPGRRIAKLIIPQPFYETDKKYIIDQLNVLYAEDKEDKLN